jgi:addiction module HigA family antidote
MARTPIHPEEHLAEELKNLGISAVALARQIEVPVNRITEIMNGQRRVTADTALHLGHWFGTSPEYWLNLQKLYELRLAREEVGNQLKKLPTLVRRKADAFETREWKHSPGTELCAQTQGNRRISSRRAPPS